jgi:two-component system sensor histidine kinase TctE
MSHTASIQQRILISAALLFSLIGLVLFAMAQHLGQRAADEAFDRVLSAAALSIADTIEIQDGGQFAVDIPYAAFAILGTSKLNRIFYKIAAPDGSVVTGSPLLGLDLPPAVGPDMRLVDSTYRGAPVRIASVARYHAGMGGLEGGWVDIVVGETREAREELSRQLTFNAVFPAIAVATLAFLLIGLSVRQAFVPLRAVENAIRQRAPSDLGPITGAVPREAQALVSTLNEFMERLDSALTGLKRVTADAAHQLRTPLTALRALAQIAVEEAPAGPLRDRIERIHANAVGATVLANQLLSDATVLHRLETQASESVDFVALVREAVDRLEAREEALAMRITSDLPDQRVLVECDPVAAREMVRNLIENALVHSQGPVEVSLVRHRSSVDLVIADRGPGIPPEMRTRVFERFVRGDEFGPGSGLGLAIVDAVIRASHGTISLEDRPGGGLVVTARLPRKPSPNRAVLGLMLLLAPLAVGMGLQPHPTWAQSASRIEIMGPVEPSRMSAALDLLSRTGLSADYVQARPRQIASRIQTGAQPAPDLVILPAPDMAVWLANEGHGYPNYPQVDPGSGQVSHWRNEVFAIASEPAVFVFRSDAFTATEIPQSRLALARLLETNAERLSMRAGLVNIGIDELSYTLAAQDSLRSPLFWRVARAFGAAAARIYDTPDEMLVALREGKIDLAYNVPLSVARVYAEADPNIKIVIPADYALALPWVALIPATAKRPDLAGIAIDALLGPDGQKALVGQLSDATPTNLQRVELGPELLVYLDAMKRTRFLDTWFQLVTQ